MSSPEGRKAHVAPSVTALPKIVMAAATLEEMIGGTRVRSGGDCGGGDGGGGEGEGGGGEGEGGGGEGEGGGGDGGGGGGAGQVETVPRTPVRVVAQEQTAAVQTTKTLGPWAWRGEREVTMEVTKARHPTGAMGKFEVSAARTYEYCY